MRTRMMVGFVFVLASIMLAGCGGSAGQSTLTSAATPAATPGVVGGITGAPTGRVSWTIDLKELYGPTDRSRAYEEMWVAVSVTQGGRTIVPDPVQVAPDGTATVSLDLDCGDWCLTYMRVGRWYPPFEFIPVWVDTGEVTFTVSPSETVNVPVVLVPAKGAVTFTVNLAG